MLFLEVIYVFFFYHVYHFLYHILRSLGCNCKEGSKQQHLVIEINRNIQGGSNCYFEYLCSVLFPCYRQDDPYVQAVRDLSLMTVERFG